MSADIDLLIWIHRDWQQPWADLLFEWVSARLTFAFPLLGLFILDSLRRAGWNGLKLGLALGLTIACGDALGALLKTLLEAPRPCFDLFPLVVPPEGEACGGQLSGMPSNHALNFALVAMFITRLAPWRAWHIGLWIATILVALSRIYLGKHYPSQVLAGLALGSACGWLGAWLALRFAAWPQALRARP